jgi:hypothetical protein
LIFVFNLKQTSKSHSPSVCRKRFSFLQNKNSNNYNNHLIDQTNQNEPLNTNNLLKFTLKKKLSNKEKTVDLVESSQISSNSNSLTHELTKKIQTTLSLKKHTPLGTILFLNPMMNKKYSSEVNKILI